MAWPYRRWLKAFAAWSRRQQVERLEHQHDLQVAALYANTNWDDEHNNRDEYISKVGQHYQNIIDLVGRDPDEVRAEQAAIDAAEAADPFLRAGRRNVPSLPPIMPAEHEVGRVV